MNEGDFYKNLMYEHEVLRAKYEIREHYLQHVVQEIYENVGQVLSLVRVKLISLSDEHRIDEQDDQDPGSLVGQAILDLRNMCRSFYTETEVLKKQGMAEALDHELRLLGNDKKNQVQIKGEPHTFSAGIEVIVLRILQEIFILVAKQQAELQLVCIIQYTSKYANFFVEYSGDSLTWDRSASAASELGLTRLTVPERIALIGGKLQVKTIAQNIIRIKLQIPLKTSVYDF